MTENTNAITFNLVVPTVFPKFNAAKGLDATHTSDKLTVQRMKHKHFRILQTMSEAKQLHYLMCELTGLHQDDVDELDAEDSAMLSEVLFGFMQKYTEIAQKIISQVTLK